MAVGCLPPGTFPVLETPPLKVVPMVAPGPVDPTLIPALEEMIEKARTGELHCVAIAAVNRDGSVTTMCGPPYQHAFAMFGAIERLKLRFHALHVMEPEE